jgi:hypothetical protein
MAPDAFCTKLVEMAEMRVVVTVAVPEIRAQADELAERIAALAATGAERAA